MSHSFGHWGALEASSEMDDTSKEEEEKKHTQLGAQMALVRPLSGPAPIHSWHLFTCAGHCSLGRTRGGGGGLSLEASERGGGGVGLVPVGPAGCQAQQFARRLQAT